jgi:hypothetical protein
MFSALLALTLRSLSLKRTLPTTIFSAKSAKSLIDCAEPSNRCDSGDRKESSSMPDPQLTW